MISLDLFTAELKNDKQKLPISLSDADLNNASKEAIDNFTSLLSVISQRNSLSFERIKFCNLDFNKVLLPIFQAINKNAEIYHLSFYNSAIEQLNDDALKRIYELTKQNIRSLDLSYNKLGTSNATVNFLAKFIQSNLKELVCNGTKLAECGFDKVRDLMQLFAANKSLTRLDLDLNFEENIKIGELLLILFSGNISKISLCYSSLQSTSIDDWKKVFDIIKNKNKLKYLNLFYCGLGLLDMNVRIQAEAGTGNSEDFVNTFGHFLQSTSLEVIDISDNDFLKETTIALLEYSMRNPKLKLICERNGLTKKEMEDLKMRFENKQKTKMDIPKIAPIKTFAPLLVTFPASTAAPAKTLNDIKEPEKPKTSFK
jgi:hypothetical protein